MQPMSLLGWLRGGSDEVGWDDLVRRVAEAIAEQARYGARGRLAFPAEVEVHIEVAGGGAAVARDFAGQAEFDRAVGAQLANRCDCPIGDLPLRDYRVEEGGRTRITVVEAASRPWAIVVEGGDRDGVEVRLPVGQDELRFGRGEWHGADRGARNDIVASANGEFVSRRAGRLFRVGNRLEVEALDQADDLLVRRSDGTTVRPARTASGRVSLAAGDAVELVDGVSGGRLVRLQVRRG
jgi:hypothetical protein